MKILTSKNTQDVIDRIKFKDGSRENRGWERMIKVVEIA